MRSCVSPTGAELRTEGMGRTEIQHKLGELIMAMRSVLRRVGIPWRGVLASTEPILSDIADVLRWPGSLDVSAKASDA